MDKVRKENDSSGAEGPNVDAIEPKAEALKTLANRLGHDLNNILTIIGGLAELGQLQAEEGSEAREFFVEIGKAETRARALVQEVLDASANGLAEGLSEES